MSAGELIRYVLAPGFIAEVIAQNLELSFSIFSHAETVWIVVLITAFTGYMAYLYEVSRRARLSEMRALALMEAERRKAEHDAKIQSEQSRYHWDRDFEKIMSWREQITGCGTAREVSPWQ